jgi:hypothetical protein
MARRRLAFLCAVLLAVLAAVLAVLIARGGGGPQVREGDPPAQGENAPSATPSGTTPSAPGLGAAPAFGNAVPAPRPDGEPARLVRLRARVVGDRRRPVPNVPVRCLSRGSPPLVATSALDGTVVFDVVGLVPGRWNSVGLYANDGAGRVALREVGLVVPATPGTSVDVGALELAPSTTLAVRVLGADGPARGVTVSASVVVAYSAARIAEAATGPDGVATLGGLPQGWVQVLAVSDGRCGRAETRLPRNDAAPVEVVLGADRSLVVRVLEDETNRPVAGATVELKAAMQTRDDRQSMAALDPSVSIPPTDAEGRVTVRAMYAGDLRVYASAPSHLEGVSRELGTDETEVVLRLPRPRTVTFRLEAGEVAPPPEGTRLEVREWPNEPALPATARVSGGAIVVDGAGPGDARGLAVAPDGSLAMLLASEDTPDGAPTSFRRPRRMEVRVVDDVGHGVPGIGVQARGQNGSPWTDPLQTDAEGRAVLDGLPASLFEIHAGVTPLDDWGEEAEEVDLAKGDARVEVVLGPEREVEVRVRVNDEPRLPAGLECDVGDAILLSSTEDADRGTVRLRVRTRSTDPDAGVDVAAPGFLRTHARFRWGSPGTMARAVVDLRRTATIVADVRARAGQKVLVALEAAAADGSGRWGTMQYSLPQWDDAGERRLEGVWPGTYRLIERWTGLTHEGIVVTAGEEARVTLDVSDAYEVTGRVRVPDGYDASQAQVASEGRSVDTSSEYGRGRRVVKDGTFTVSVPGGRPVTLRAFHPELDPDPKAGAVVVTAARSDVTLALVERATATMRLAFPAGISTDELDDGWVVVRDEATGEDVSHHSLRRGDGGVWRFSGFQPGTRTVVLDLVVCAPRALRGVVLAAGRTDLGEVTLERGSALTVRLVGGEGSDPPEISGSLEFAGEPSYERHFEQEGGVLRFRGLGAGTFRATFHWTDPTDREHAVEREITVDGRTDAVIDLDVR